MRKSYIRRVSEGGLFDPGVCYVCGRRGLHEECDRKEAEVEQKYIENDIAYLVQYGAKKKYGVSEESDESFRVALRALTTFLGQEPNFDVGQTVEGDSWWYFPCGWIGVIGFIVEKGGGNVFSLGSGLGSLSASQCVPAHWAAIEAYVCRRVQLTQEGT